MCFFLHWQFPKLCNMTWNCDCVCSCKYHMFLSLCLNVEGKKMNHPDNDKLSIIYKLINYWINQWNHNQISKWQYMLTKSTRLDIKNDQNIFFFGIFRSLLISTILIELVSIYWYYILYRNTFEIRQNDQRKRSRFAVSNHYLIVCQLVN